MKRLEGRTAVITGGGRGQGRAIAVKFASEGANVVVCDIASAIPTLQYDLASPTDLEETASEVEKAGGVCIARVADVRDQAALDAVVNQAISEFGQVDIMVANAGIVDYKPFWEITEDEWKDQIDVNLTGAWHSAKAVANHMRERMQGCIVFTSSLNGIEGGMNYAHYIAAKHGVCGLMKSVALELGPYNVRATAVLPGPVDTLINDNPVGRDRIVGKEGATRDEYLAAIRSWHILRGRPSLPARAIADAMIWLVSDEARHVTGIELVVDAGHNVLPGMNPWPVEDWAAFGEEHTMESTELASSGGA